MQFITLLCFMTEPGALVNGIIFHRNSSKKSSAESEEREILKKTSTYLEDIDTVRFFPPLSVVSQNRSKQHLTIPKHMPEKVYAFMQALAMCLL